MVGHGVDAVVGGGGVRALQKILGRRPQGRRASDVLPELEDQVRAKGSGPPYRITVVIVTIGYDLSVCTAV